VDVALCARALSVAYRVLAIDDPLQANPRGVKLWEWESRALGLEHFAEFVRVEIARAEGRTQNYVSAKSYYNAAVLTRSALGIQVRLTPHSTKNTTPATGEIKHGRADQRFSKLPWAASVPTTEKPQERSEKAGASHKVQPFDILSDVGPAYACFGNSEDLESQPAARQREPRPDSPGDPVALNRKLELAIKRKARPGDSEKTSSKTSRKSPSPPILEPNTSPDVEEVLETVDLDSPAKKQENTFANPVASSSTDSAPNNTLPQAANSDFTSRVETSTVSESTGTASCSSRGSSRSTTVAAATPTQTSVVPCQTNSGGNGGRVGINSQPLFGWSENSWAPQYQQYSCSNNADWSNFYYTPPAYQQQGPWTNTYSASPVASRTLPQYSGNQYSHHTAPYSSPAAQQQPQPSQAPPLAQAPPPSIAPPTPLTPATPAGFREPLAVGQNDDQLRRALTNPPRR
jgi:hypothetical protein